MVEQVNKYEGLGRRFEDHRSFFLGQVHSEYIVRGVEKSITLFASTGGNLGGSMTRLDFSYLIFFFFFFCRIGLAINI